jgi:hypothetical protein
MEVKVYDSVQNYSGQYLVMLPQLSHEPEPPIVDVHKPNLLNEYYFGA